MRNINVRNLFIVACVLKVASALAGWHFNSPWLLGFALPLSVMVVYMWLGATRRNDEVSDEKFADSCYYLGFIFTIASISVALMDLPNIGTHIQDIAVRFGASMLSTVLGLSVRVAMVTFRKDFGDAIQNAEEGVVEASIRFRDQLGTALGRLGAFESAVDQAARLSVERVNLQVENLSKNHSERLSEFFTDLTRGHQEGFAAALGEVKGASARLSESVDGYALGMRSNLSSIESKVVDFTEAITQRLKTTTFPDDYFAKHLEHPLGRLKSAADQVHEHMVDVSTAVGESTSVLSMALKKLRDKASTTEAALSTVTKLATQQQLLMEGAQGQADQLEHLGSTLLGLDDVLERAMRGFKDAKAKDEELRDAIRSVVADSEANRKEVREWLKGVADELVAATEGHNRNFDQARVSLQAAAQSNVSLAGRMETANAATTDKLLEGANANLRASERLASSAAATEMAAGKLEILASADARVAETLSALGQTATAGLNRVDAAVEQLQSIARRLGAGDLLTAGRTEIRGGSGHFAPARPTPPPPPSEFSYGSPTTTVSTLNRLVPADQAVPGEQTYVFSEIGRATQTGAPLSQSSQAPQGDSDILVRQLHPTT